MSKAHSKTHDEIMTEDGFELINRKKRRLVRPNISPAKIRRNEEVSSLNSSPEQTESTMQHAHKTIHHYLDTYLQRFIETLKLAIGSHQLLLIRAIGIGNFCERNSDSSLQLAVLENIRSAFNKPSCFYQEPRCTDTETHYLESKEINVIQADSLNEVPTQIADLIKDSSKSFCVVFMVHFDHFGFERVFNSFESLNTDHQLIFIGNELPIDYKGELQKKLSNFKIESVPLPPKPVQSIGNQKEKSFMWYRKAFAHTSIYVQNDT